MFEIFQDLDFTLSLVLIFCIICACGFEFVNGFHDTANAVATVIYTHSLEPMQAVVWSGIWNFLGVFAGGISVAMGIVYLLPIETLTDQNVWHSVALVLAILFSAIIWNLGTWYFGIPCSSSHTLIGSILGVGIAYSMLPESMGAAVNWSKASDIGLSLLFSPLLGCGFTIFLMYILKRTVKDKSIFKEPHKSKKPPVWIRTILILTCTGVSFSHGSNDGQKGVGLMMLIMISIVPSYFALNRDKNIFDVDKNLIVVERTISEINMKGISHKDSTAIEKINKNIARLKTQLLGTDSSNIRLKENRFAARAELLTINKGCETLLKSEKVKLSEEDKKVLKDQVYSLKQHTDYAPSWIVWMISLSLGLGTMIGWKRIVVTIGEKIGKQHLTYAQGASSELVASITIGLSSWVGLPVSTTQVLSSGIAGSMIATSGTKNLQPATIKSIIIAWILTLPVCIFLSGSLFFLFRAIF